MSSSIKVEVGPQRISDGGPPNPARGGSYGELLTGGMNGFFAEQVMRGNGYVFESALAGVALIAPTTTNNKMLIVNPANSGRVLVLQKVNFARTAVGTPLEGAIVYARARNILTVSTAAGTGNDVVSYTAVAAANLRSDLLDNSQMIFAPAASVVTTAPTYWGSPGVGQTADAGATTLTGPKTDGVTDWIYGMLQLWPGCLMCVGASVSLSTTYHVSLFGISLPLPLINS